MVITVLLFFANNGKPFFFQPRPGKNGKIFKIVKFKTMNDKKDDHGNLLSDEHRLTKIGSFVKIIDSPEIGWYNVKTTNGKMTIYGDAITDFEYHTTIPDYSKNMLKSFIKD